jgi:hypothetical protein
MSETKNARWLCHRCIKKEGVEVDPDPVPIRVCDGCNVENYVRIIKNESIPPMIKMAAATVAEEGIELEAETVPSKKEGFEITQPDASEEEIEELVKRADKIEAEIAEEPDPYKGLTKDQLVELLKEKEE